MYYFIDTCSDVFYQKKYNIYCDFAFLFWVQTHIEFLELDGFFFCRACTNDQKTCYVFIGILIFR